MSTPQTALLMDLAEELKTRKLLTYQPYRKQKLFHALGRTKRERCNLSANQSGKTLCGGAEWAMHLTGQYPDWWEGRTWDRPVKLWAAGNSNETTRDNPQRILMGEPGEWGTGWIPKNFIVG